MYRLLSLFIFFYNKYVRSFSLRTEVISNPQELNWTKGIAVEFVFEQIHEFQLEVWNGPGNYQYGSCKFSLVEAITGQTSELDLTKTRSDGGAIVELDITEKVGLIQLTASPVLNQAGVTFVNYLASGWKLNMMIGIDFTGSNKYPMRPDSLHHHSGLSATHSLSQYEQAISSLGQVIAHYDNDGLYPVYGFGGHKAHQPVDHCFALNHNPNQPSVKGVEGILDVYKKAFATWGLSKPTHFEPIIKKATELASSGVPNPHPPGTYTILLMLTDGIITDLEQTIEAIVAASKLPLSIIIVGVGDADFSAMKTLDSDNVELRDANGNVWDRDIVQFVDLKEHREADGSVSHDSLVKAALEELPEQMLRYFTRNNIVPPPSPLSPLSPSPPPPQQAAEAATAFVTVEVPEGGSGGMRMSVDLPNGRTEIVTIPDGFLPRQMFQYRYNM
jgi:hypothetical protein